MLYFLWAFFFSAHASAALQCATTPTIRDVKEVPCMPPVLNQRDAEWCFLFSSHALLQQHVCLESNDRKNVPKVALRGVIQAYNGSFGTIDNNLEALPNARLYDWKRPGFMSNALEAAAKKKRLPQESCAPMAELLKWRDELPVTKEKLTPTELLRVNYERIESSGSRTPAHTPEKKTCELISVSTAQLSEIPGFAVDVYAAASDAFGDAGAFLNQVFVPSRCEKSEVSLPAMKIGTSNPRDAAGIKNLLSKLLAKDRAVGYGVCRSALGGKTECGGGHAIVVAGTRKVCCGETCEIDYKVFDSSPMWPVEADGSSWISEERFVRSALMWSREKEEKIDVPIKSEIRLLEIQISKVMADSSLNTKEKARQLGNLRHLLDGRRRNSVMSGSASWIETP